MSDAIRTAEAEIDSIETTARLLSTAVAHEMACEIETTELAFHIRDLLIGSDNPATGKPHSASSADAAAKDSVSYRDAKRRHAQAVAAKILADGDYQAAKIRARLAVACVEVTV